MREIDERNTDGRVQDYLSLMANVGVIPYEEKGDIGNKKPEDLSKCKLVAPNDFVINSMNYQIGSYGVSDYSGVCSPVYIVLRHLPHAANLRFALRIFQTKPFQKYAQSFGNGILDHRRAISWNTLKNLRVPLPPLQEQGLIADFLDAETAKIDSLIAKQEQLIATLREDRTATINHAVTKGLNPGVDFKESSIEWAGEIPAGWPVTKIKRLFTVTLGKMLQSEPRSDADLLQPYLRAAHIPPTGFTTEGVTEMWFSPEEARELDLRGGDVVVVEGGMGGYGRCDLVPHDLVGWGFQNSINRLRPRNGAIGEYVMYALQMAREHGFIEALCSVSTMPHLTAEKLGEMRIPGPTAEQQREIVEFLNDACSKIDRLIAKANEVVGRLREYRSALITDAVTGKIDVRGLA